MAWPSPLAVNLHMYCDAGTDVTDRDGPASGSPPWLAGRPALLQVPVRDDLHSSAVAADGALPAFSKPVGAPPMRISTVVKGGLSR